MILANGLPAESYYDCGTRALYATVDGPSGQPVDEVASRFDRIMFDATVQDIHARLARTADGMGGVAELAA